ncbi:MAG: glycosyltransferase family 2 protein [Thermoplasmata archaeon]|nr:glycosyltransferase family 2 protein [Thermoplasmata archaeon]
MGTHFDFRTLTAERYNAVIRDAGQFRLVAVLVVLACSTVAGLLVPPLMQGHGGQWERDLTVVWFLPVPLLLLSLLGYVAWFRPSRLLLRPREELPDVPDPAVHFQVTTTGVNWRTVQRTVESVQYWTARHPEVCYTSQVWIVIEGSGYRENPAVFDALRASGVELVIVPVDYQAPGGSLRKSRALHYSVEERRRRGIDLAETWVYHHDDETAVGEDTILGLDEFLRAHGSHAAVGMGIILYPQEADDYRPTVIADFARASDDFRNMLTITGRRNVLGGFHGSHYVVRADIEDRVGYDVGRNLIVSEDFFFEARTRETYGDIFHPLKGFAYEESPLDLKDQLKQRRRWVWNLRSGLVHLPISPARRAVLAYSLTAWMAALLSTGLIGASLLLGFEALLPIGAALAGMVWSIMFLRYYVGYRLCRQYLPPRPSVVRMIGRGIVGALVDGAAVWAGMLTRQRRRFEVVQKDRQEPRDAISLRPMTDRASYATKQADPRALRATGATDGPIP